MGGEAGPRPSWAPPAPFLRDDSEGDKRGEKKQRQSSGGAPQGPIHVPAARAVQQHDRAKAAESENEPYREALMKARQETKETKAMLDALRKKCEAQEETIKEKEKAIVGLTRELADAQDALEELRSRGRSLRYDDIHDGLLSKNVKTFTYFPTAKLNDKFLETVNIKNKRDYGPDDAGMCTRLVRYRGFSKAHRSGEGTPGVAGGASGRRPRKFDYKT